MMQFKDVHFGAELNLLNAVYSFFLLFELDFIRLVMGILYISLLAIPVLYLFCSFTSLSCYKEIPVILS